MGAVVIVNVSLILLAAAAWFLPMKSIAGLISDFHAVIGITPPGPEQLRWVIIAWIVSLLVIFDVMVLLFLYVF